MPMKSSGLVLLLAASLAQGDRIVLKDGFELSGALNVAESQVTVRTPLRTYFVAAARLLKPEVADDAEPSEAYSLKQPLSRNVRPFESVSRVVRTDAFDPFGRRTIYLTDSKGREVAIHQGITEIHPTHVVVEGINFGWRSVLSISEIPAEELIAILRQATPADSLPAQLKFLSFLLQAKMYKQASAMLEEARRHFPEAGSQLEEISSKLAASLSRDAISVAQRSLAAGQIAKAKRIASEVPPWLVGGSEELAWKELQERIARGERDIETARALVKDSLAAAKEPSPEVHAVAEEIVELVGPPSIERLRPLLDLMDQAKTADELLSLGVSGWIAGAKLATSDPQESARLARHRWLIQKMIEPVPVDEFEIGLDTLAREGIDAELAVHLTPLLPAPPAETSSGEISEVQNGDVRYLVLLPKEYDRMGRHALVVALHGIHSHRQEQIEFWKPAVEAGMIIVAPEYLHGENQPYEYSAEEHGRVLAVLADARRRFAVDSNRVFLSGHEVGGYAAFDIGMSHPDEFAGLISFSGVPMFYAQYYWRNVGRLPIYAVEGSLNGGNPAAIRSNFTRFFQKGYPAVYVEYAGRGGGMFAAELPKILAWMDSKTREPFPAEVEAMSARHSDRRFYWMEADAFRPGSTIAPKLFDKKKGLKPAKMNGARVMANALDIQIAGLDSVNVLLSPQLVQLDDPNLSVRVNRKVIHSGPIKPDLGVLLRTIRDTGDRQRLVVAILRAGT